MSEIDAEHELTIRPASEPGDLGWVVMAHGELYAREHGWDATFEALVARIVADFATGADAARERAWVAVDRRGERRGCVACTAADAETAQLRLLLVDPRARGSGLGGALIDTCVDFARAAGYRRLTLWTQASLAAALRLYRARGFELVRERPHSSFGAELVGQTYELSLAS